MFALRFSERFIMKPEKRMKRSCFVMDWELEGGGGAEIMNRAHRFRLRGAVVDAMNLSVKETRYGR